MRARFGPFTFDSETRELRRSEEALHVSPKAFDLLQRLIESTPRALSKREILDLVWPATFVSSGTLAAVVAELRRALGDAARQPRYIRTVHRFGYAFCAAIDRLPERAAKSGEPICRLILGRREIALLPGDNLLGRNQDAVAWIDDASISRLHAIIHIVSGKATIEDLGSKNGTFVKGARIEGSQLLSDGDILMVGRVPMVFRIFPDSGSTESVKLGRGDRPRRVR
jgi:DNA-binding winged helix-turn-helix (wHTH) protein